MKLTFFTAFDFDLFSNGNRKTPTANVIHVTESELNVWYLHAIFLLSIEYVIAVHVR